jgi:hypothetical protein
VFFGLVFGIGDYPVYIFAVEGGGIYAVSAAARYLSMLQGICPQFAKHVFAISVALCSTS